MDEFKAGPMSRLEIRRLADRFRRSFHLDPTKAVDVLWLLEAVFPTAFASLGFDYEIKPKEEMGKIHGLTDLINNVIYIREDVYENAAQGKGRDRLTVAHELAHYVLHDGVTIGLARKLDDEMIPLYCSPEWQATCFGAELLMPADQIRHMTVDEIVETYGVSSAAAAYQLRVLKK